MLKTLVRSGGGCKQIRRYLEKEGRAVAWACSGDVDMARWDEDFDETRRMWGKDDGRKYYHFIVSPDPADGIDAQALVDLATDWVQRRYPDGQWVVEVHEDNGIPHAHIVLNSVIPDTGRKVHISNGEVQGDAAELQLLCKERGLSAFDNYEIVRDDEDGAWIAKSPWPKRGERAGRRAARRNLTQGQRWLRAKGVRLWTDDMHDAIEEALRGCRTWSAFERELDKRGYRAQASRRGALTFYPPDGKGHPVKGYKLDDSYTVDGIRSRLRPNLDRRPAAKTAQRGSGALMLPTTFAEQVTMQAERGHRRGRSDIDRFKAQLDAITIIKMNGFRNADQMRRAAKDLENRAAELDRSLDDAKLACEQIEKAVAMAIERDAAKSRMTARPSGALAVRRWEKENAEELRSVESAEKWLEERGLTARATVSELQERRTGMMAELREIADEAEERGRQAGCVRDALAAIGELPGIAEGRPADPGRRGRGKQAPSGRRRVARYATAAEFREDMRIRQEAQARAGRELVEGTLTAQRLAQIVGEIEAEEARRTKDVRTAIEATRTGAPNGGAAHAGKRRGASGREATEKQMAFIRDLVEKGIVSEDEVAALGDRPTIVSANLLLNRHRSHAGFLDLGAGRGDASEATTRSRQ